MTFRHWLVFFCCCALLSCSLGLGVNAYGVFLTPVTDALGVGKASVSLHITLSGLSVAFLNPILVRLLKRGPFHLILGFCVLLNSLSYLLMGFANRLWMFYLLGILRGIGSAGFYTATCTMILGNWFRARLGTFTGILVSFSGIAGALLSPLLTAIITQFGYRAGYFFCAAFVVLLSLPAPFLISLHPKEKGFSPYETEAPQTACAATHDSIRLVHKLSYTSPLFLLIMIFSFALGFEVGIVSHLSGYAQNIGLGAAVGAAVMSACMASNITFKTLYGIMSDHMPPMVVSVIMVCLNISGMTLLAFARSLPLLLLGGFLFGSVYSLTTVGLAALVRDQYGNRQYGDVFSLGTSMGSLANAIAITLIGVGFDLTGSYRIPLLFYIALACCNMVLLLSICSLGKKNRTLEDRDP